MKIAFIGFGEAGQAYGGSLAALDGVEVYAYDVIQGLAARAPALGVRFCTDPTEAVTGADLVISAVTAAQSLEAVETIAPLLEQGQVLVDLNSVSAARKQATAEVVRGRNAAYVDMAVMAPVHPRHHRTSALIAGDFDGRAADLLSALDFRTEVIGPEVGAATTIKMIRSLVVKGIEALTVQALTAAEATGCYARVNASLKATFDGLNWDRHVGYQFERMTRHGIRRAAEMRESSVAYAELGFPVGADLAAAVAALQDIIGSARIDPKLLEDTDPPARAVLPILQGAGPDNPTA